MVDSTGVVLILMPLKLVQAEQNSMINRIPNDALVSLSLMEFSKKAGGYRIEVSGGIPH